MRGAWAAAMAGAAGLIAGVTLAPSGASASVSDAELGNISATRLRLASQDPQAAVISNLSGGLALLADSDAKGPALIAQNSGGTGPGAYVQRWDTGTGEPALVAETTGDRGRGGQFFGGAAQVQLYPARTVHPKSGQRGDLFVDKDGRLWFCKGGTTWKQLA